MFQPVISIFVLLTKWNCMIRIVHTKKKHHRQNQLPIGGNWNHADIFHVTMEKPCCNILFVAMYDCYILKSIICNCKLVFLSAVYTTIYDETIELLNNKSPGLLPPGGFLSLTFDQPAPYYSQRHLASWNAIYILHR